MKDTYLFGYYGMHNCGDNALMLAAAWGAKKYLEADKLCFNSPTTLSIPYIGKYPAMLPEQQCIPGQNRFSQYLAALQSKSIIFGGGSIFHCSRDINLARHLMKLSKGPHRALGVGLGPFKDINAENSCREFLKQCDYVGVRDQESLDIAMALAPDSNVELTFDLAPLLLDIPGVTGSILPARRKGIGVALCPHERLSGDDTTERLRLENLAADLAEVYYATGEPIFLIDLNGHKTYGDKQVHRELQQYIPSNIPVFLIDYQSNPLHVLVRLSRLKVMVGMRLHACILSMLCKTPVIALNYHSKCVAWCKQAGVPEEYRFEVTKIERSRFRNVLKHGLSDRFSDSILHPLHAMLQAKRNFAETDEMKEGVLC